MQRSLAICPRCRVQMTYIQEVERLNGTRKIVRYYRCPVCGLKVLDEVLKIVRVNGSLKILVEKIERAIIENNGRNGNRKPRRGVSSRAGRGRQP